MKTPEQVAAETYRTLANLPLKLSGGRLREIMTLAIVADRAQRDDEPGLTERQLACEHPVDRVQLAEDGYTRDWGTTIDVENRIITASFNGSEDWGDEGDGNLYLHCHQCGADRPIPDGYEIDYV